MVVTFLVLVIFTLIHSNYLTLYSLGTLAPFFSQLETGDTDAEHTEQQALFKVGLWICNMSKPVDNDIHVCSNPYIRP